MRSSPISSPRRSPATPRSVLTLGTSSPTMPAQGKARQGFFTAEELERLCMHLPVHAQNAVRFAWQTGWRRGEIFGLRWQDVDLVEEVVYLNDSKNGEPRVLPYGQSELLARIIREQRASASAFELRYGRAVAHVFQTRGGLFHRA